MTVAEASRLYRALLVLDEGAPEVVVDDKGDRKLAMLPHRITSGKVRYNLLRNRELLKPVAEAAGKTHDTLVTDIAAKHGLTPPIAKAEHPEAFAEYEREWAAAQAQDAGLAKLHQIDEDDFIRLLENPIQDAVASELRRWLVIEKP